VIALDSSSLIAHLGGEAGADVDAVDEALERGDAVLPPVVLVELLGDPKLPAAVAKLLLELPLLSPAEGFWERAGKLRARVVARGHKVRLADALIAQSCIDHRVALVTRDRDFRHYAGPGGLRLHR
jgi:predicted nucleic acid-binding protein